MGEKTWGPAWAMVSAEESWGSESGQAWATVSAEKSWVCEWEQELG